MRWRNSFLDIYDNDDVVDAFFTTHYNPPWTKVSIRIETDLLPLHFTH
jgi:hypothetical protein